MEYFRDMAATGHADGPEPVDIKVKPGDKLTVVVKSRDSKQSFLFNLPSNPADSIGGGNALYTVDDGGAIDFPVAGSIQVGGMTRLQVANHIKSVLRERQLLDDAVVTVEYGNLSVAVMGEVARPGRYAVDRDRISLLDALSMAGDLTRRADRRKVAVVRMSQGRTTTYYINLQSAAEAFASPAFYLQQGDVVYAAPRK